MIIPLESVTRTDLSIGGGKAANLGEMIQAGFPVPPGRIVTTDTYKEMLADMRVAPSDSEDSSEGIRTRISGASLPEHCLTQLTAATAQLPGPFAVRSSATAEDLDDASFAGQQETLLGVLHADLPAAICQCWASLWSERAIAYRKEQGVSDEHIAIAVVIQQMIPSDSAGVAFSRNPLNGAEEVLIESSWGLGESVVSGAVTPDAYIVGKDIQHNIGLKQTRIDLAPGGNTLTTTVANPQAPSLTDRQIYDIADLARRVEKHYGIPMDIEWAIHDDKLWLLQARPITTGISAKEDVTREVASEISYSYQKGLHGMVARFIHRDLIEHFPSPYPLDLSCFSFIMRIIASAGSAMGLEIRNANDLLTMNEDGVAYIRSPRVSLRHAWRLPGHLRATGRHNPRAWHSGPGKRIENATRKYAALTPSDLSDQDLAGTMDLLIKEGIAMETQRVQYLIRYISSGAILQAYLRLARAPFNQFDLLGELDYVSATILKKMAALASSAPPEASRLLAEKPINIGALKSTQWWTRVEEFLDIYGARTTTMYQPFSATSWREDVPGFLSLLAMSVDTPAPRPRHKRLTEKIAARLPRYMRPNFHRTLDDFRQGHVMREISVLQFENLGALLRSFAKEAGQRLHSRGLIDRPDQVLFLTMEELLAYLRGARFDISAVVAKRERSRPRALREWTGALRAATAQMSQTNAETLRGVPASPGIVTSTVRIIREPADFPRLQPGDILLCHTTDPAWTPLFARAAGVITEVGGRLSHAAIVAREYGIPAVMGINGALHLPDGARVEVNGNRGEVSLLDTFR
ncbi:MAG: PEP/pyruvate-binding domain-containing protein [Actinomycetaceae bacterium]|nr:PEP/pyruvate-binding domain-containing protein [Actinomycetaceae bacterium]